MVHHLQQYIKYVRVRLFNFIKQQNRVGVLADGISEDTALVKADIAGRRADKPRHRVLFHVLAHVKALELHAQHGSKLFCHFGLAHAGGADKEK